MARAFADIAFTDSVKEIQVRYGSRNVYSGLAFDLDQSDRLTEFEINFLSESDSFYLGTVGENGWPYVQHRGGPKGVLQVLDDKTIAYAEFNGNQQYISLGNIHANEKVLLFVMDYPNRRRLKIWARAQLVDANINVELIARMNNLEYPARADRAVLLSVEAIDWNCPQHITQRFSNAEIAQVLTPLLEENHMLKLQLAQALKNTKTYGESP